MISIWKLEEVWTLHRVGCQAKLNNRWRRSLVREVTKTPMVTLTQLQRLSVESGAPSRRTTISAILHQSRLYVRLARRMLLLSKRHITARLRDSQTMINKIICLNRDWTVSLNVKLHVWRKPRNAYHLANIISIVKYSGRSIILLGKMNFAKYRHPWLKPSPECCEPPDKGSSSNEPKPIAQVFKHKMQGIMR